MARANPPNPAPNPPRTLDNVADCYAHALAIEREAAARCLQFAEFLEERGETETAELFYRLHRFEHQHIQELERKAAGLPLPEVCDWEFHWINNAPSDQVDHRLVFHLMTPHDALMIALGAGKRARTLYEQSLARCEDAEVRRLAAALAEEEIEHIALLEEGLKQVPRPPFLVEEDFEALFNTASPFD